MTDEERRHLLSIKCSWDSYSAQVLSEADPELLQQLQAIFYDGAFASNQVMVEMLAQIDAKPAETLSRLALMTKTIENHRAEIVEHQEARMKGIQ